MATNLYPHAPDELTPMWLTEVLRSDGFDVEVESVTTRPLGDGVGLMGVVCFADLTYSTGEGPATVIAKFPTPTEANLAIALHFDIYRREVLFYRGVAPLTGVAVPRVYFAEVSPDDGSDFVILMEDLSGYRTGDQVAGCTPDEAGVCADELAKLHAALWNRVDDQRYEFAFLHSHPTHSDGMRNAAIGGWSNMLTHFGDSVPAFLNDVRERYLAAVPAMQRWMAEPPVTFVHGDFRLDNLLWGASDGHHPVVTLDWQGVLRSKGVQDVAYLLSQSMPVEDRRASERDLVNRWHRGLVAGGVTGYSAEQAWLDYRKAVLYLWVYATVIAGALDPSTDRGRRYMASMLERASTAIADLDGLALLPEFDA